MNFDLTQLGIAALGVVCTILGWFAREMYAAISKLRDDLGKLEVRIGTDYVRYDRLMDVMNPVLKKLDEIQTALSHKADRTDVQSALVVHKSVDRP